jgi:hypothetical protein
MDANFWADILKTVGIPTSILAYFLYKDFRYTDRDVKAKERISISLALIVRTLDIEDKAKDTEGAS